MRGFGFRLGNRRCCGAAAPLTRLGFSARASDGGFFSSLQVGGIFTATQSFTMTKLGIMGPSGGIVAGTTVRVNIYAVSGTTWGALLGTVDLAGGFASLEERTGTLGSPISIVSGNNYGLSGHSSASCNVAFATGNSVFWSDAYADGPDNPAPGAPGANAAVTPLIFGTS